ncbi:MAG: ATP-binding protein [Duncaniella sp.]|nr:ATP-binding protein [Duncaniella sp.]HBI58865.1 PAS domain-containing sensor histidine kinase [Porphyromonadaceae bacterium]
MRATWVFTAVTLLLIAGAVVAPFYVTPLKVLLVAEGCIVAILILMSVLYRSLIRPVSALINGVDLLREQDFSSRLSKVGQWDADKVVALFNDLMARLKKERLRVREQNHFLDLLIEASPMGIIILGTDNRVMMANKAAVVILKEEQLPGKTLGELDTALGAELATLEKGENKTVRLSDTKIFRLSRLSFMDQGYQRPFFMIESLTDEVMRAEKAAYEKVIRVIAHEVNNSMAGITSIFDLLSDYFAESEPDLKAAVASCSDRAMGLSRFITSYANVVRIPEPVLSRVDLVGHVESILPFLRDMCGETVGIVTMFPDVPVSVDIDTTLMEQAVINLVKNSVDSIGARRGTVTLRISVDPPVLEIIDDGPGITPEAASKLFTPFFSTKPTGQGLGLMFVAEILRRHKCGFNLSTSPVDSLTRFTIRFK